MACNSASTSTASWAIGAGVDLLGGVAHQANALRGGEQEWQARAPWRRPAERNHAVGLVLCPLVPTARKNHLACQFVRRSKSGLTVDVADGREITDADEQCRTTRSGCRCPRTPPAHPHRPGEIDHGDVHRAAFDDADGVCTNICSISELLMPAVRKSRQAPLGGCSRVVRRGRCRQSIATQSWDKTMRSP